MYPDICRATRRPTCRHAQHRTHIHSRTTHHDLILTQKSHREEDKHSEKEKRDTPEREKSLRGNRNIDTKNQQPKRIRIKIKMWGK